MDAVYQAVNTSYRSGPANASQRACQRIAAIWPGDAAADDEAVIRWILNHNPFRSKEVEDRFVGGARKMLGSAKTASPARRSARPAVAPSARPA